MSSSRGNSGETTWSKCSRRSLQDQLSQGNSLKCIFDEPSSALSTTATPGVNICLYEYAGGKV